MILIAIIRKEKEMETKFLDKLAKGIESPDILSEIFHKLLVKWYNLK